MPDNFSSEKRGKINAIFVLFVCLGAACTAATGYKFWAINYNLVFYVAAAIFLVCGALSFIFIEEPKLQNSTLSNKTISLIDYFKGILEDSRKTLYYVSDFFRWFCKSVIIQMITLFAANELGIEIGLAGQAILVFNLVKLLSSLPIGIATDKINRKQFLLAGTLLMIVAMFFGWYVHSFVSLIIVMGLFGISTTITIISGSSLLMDLLPKGREGEFIGLNTVFGAISTVISLWISGALIDMLGSYRYIFLIGFVASVLSFIFTFFIQTQDANRTKIKKNTNCLEQ